MWWVDTRVSGRHHFYAHGKHGQFIYVMPERKLVFVRFGRTDPWLRWPDTFEQIAQRLDELTAYAPAQGPGAQRSAVHVDRR
jgi:CubicO group peptidase (beta-lactamase class C family)